MEANWWAEDVMHLDNFEEDVATLRQRPGLEHHVRCLTAVITNNQLRLTFFQWYTRLCRKHARLHRGDIDTRPFFRMGWEMVKAWSHCVEDLLSIITDHDTFAAAGHARLAVHSNAVMKLFILHDYLSIFDPGSPAHPVPMLARVFALLSAINAPETYATGRSVAICALGDGGDS